MNSSSLDPDNLPVGPDRSLGRGHSNGALGPSDTSDSGSDVGGGRPTSRQPSDGLTDGGAELVGDGELDGNSDSSGTGERGGIGWGELLPEGRDVDVDRVETVPDEEENLDASR